MLIDFMVWMLTLIPSISGWIKIRKKISLKINFIFVRDGKSIVLPAFHQFLADIF